MKDPKHVIVVSPTSEYDLMFECDDIDRAVEWRDNITKHQAWANQMMKDLKISVHTLMGETEKVERFMEYNEDPPHRKAGWLTKHAVISILGHLNKRYVVLEEGLVQYFRNHDDGLDDSSDFKVICFAHSICICICVLCE